MLTTTLSYLRRKRDEFALPAAAKLEARRDHRGLPESAPDIEQVIGACIEWLCRAQDQSTTKDGGVARDFSLINGWSSSYPETTGYIVPTIIDRAEETDSDALLERARRMLDWLVRIQLPDGAYQGGRIDSKPVVPVTFNTGQILIGLARGEEAFGRYREAMVRAADWLVETQDDDGCWRQFPTPFAAGGEKSYETHVAWGLFEAARLDAGRGYAEAATANVDWALKRQRDNGWFDACCLDDPSNPLTHTIGYAIRGILEAHRFTHKPRYLDAARRASDGVLKALREDGFLPGRLGADWMPGASYACLTGSAQNAHCWLMLFEATGEQRYLDAGSRANAFVRRTVSLGTDLDRRGGVKGSFPVDGDYGSFQYLNWAPKFLVDSLVLERKIRKASQR